MVFNSIEFLLCFLPFFFLIYWLFPNKIKNPILLLGSLVFYAQGNPVHMLLLVVSVYVNFYVGLCLGDNRGYDKFEYDEEIEKKRSRKRKRRLLVAAVVGNLGVLILFKSHVGNLSLPLGISFYTFQILAYLFDVYRGNVQREGSLLQFATYITMFPKLISGPLADYGDMKEQLSGRKVKAEQVQDGLKCFTIGLGLKVLLADRVGVLWHEVQVTGFESISTPLAWMAAIAYSLKIYFDFYGYSLMAIGLGRMLGFSLPANFEHPYMARSVREFFKRWHITLGRWFCKYVYIPLGGSRRGALRTGRNLLIVWLLTAAWHGNTANFFLWGGVLWLCIMIERLLQKTGLGKYLVVLPHLYLWCVIPISWMCFAITDLQHLTVYLGRMFGQVQGIAVRTGDWQAALQNYWGLFLIGMLLCTPFPEKIYRKFKNRLPVALLLAALFWVCIHRIILEGNNPFMYFQF